MNDLKQWLEQNGFRFLKNNVKRPGNIQDWVATKSVPQARPCEVNGARALTVRPHQWIFSGQITKAFADVVIAGYVNGIWYELASSGAAPNEIMQRWPEIERNLVAAWQAIGEGK
ncbi:MAG: hypothetical protein KDK05_15690 [Candidatus Competibacteraceae bacterium]|nr:hypothetical protein [Candidatus Competibacteraceae bacterium]